MSRTTTNLEIGRAKTCFTQSKLCKWLGEKFWHSYFGAVMTSSKSRKIAIILSIFNMRNSYKTSFKLLVLKLWQEWPHENEGQKKRKILQNFFDLPV